MSKKTVAICDGETGYLEKLLDYLDQRKPAPFELYGFTELAKLYAFWEDRKSKIDVLAVAESCYEAGTESLASHVIVLNEGLGYKLGQVEIVDKYQQVRAIYKAIMSNLLEGDMDIPDEGVPETSARLIGFYSPVKRAMQTTFALELGKSLSKRYKVLYLSFEHYAGWDGLLCREGGKDLTDLIYYLKEDAEHFAYRLKLAEQRLGTLNYIPPAYAGQNLIYVTAKEWLRLLERLKQFGGYDFVLLDLSDSLQGIFEILRMCERIFTVTLPDGPAQNKIKQYEYLLKMYEYEDVLVKTRNSASDMIARLEMMVLMGMNIPLKAIKTQIVTGVDILIHLGRLRDGSRKVLEVCEVEGLTDEQITLRQLYKFEETGQKDGKVVGIFEKKQNLLHLDKCKTAALSESFGCVD